MEELTPRQIVAELDKYIIGQSAAKRAVAIALRDRQRRKKLPDDMRDEIVPKNILMIGPTGVGKTEIARRLASLAHAPFVKVEATKFTEVGYVGRDVDSMVRDLVQASLRIIERERKAEVRDQAVERAIERVVDLLQPRSKEPDRSANSVPPTKEAMLETFNSLFSIGATVHEARPDPDPEPAPDDEVSRRKAQQENRVRERLREQIRSGARDTDLVDVEITEPGPPPFLQVLGPQGPMDDPGGMDMQGIMGALMPKKRRTKSLTIKEALEHFTDVEAANLIDQDQLNRDAIERAEQEGIIFIDEMDKVAGRSGEGGGRGPDVSREGVQRDLLPIIEGSSVQTRQGVIKTDYILFIAAGAFHLSKPSDLIPELQGRLPIRVELDSLSESDLQRILTEPKNALIKQYKALLGTEGVDLQFDEGAIAETARIAAQVNAQTENIGARRLHTVMERLLDEISFNAPENEGTSCKIDAAFVQDRLKDAAENEDLSRYIL